MTSFYGIAFKYFIGLLCILLLQMVIQTLFNFCYLNLVSKPILKIFEQRKQFMIYKFIYFIRFQIGNHFWNLNPISCLSNCNGYCNIKRLSENCRTFISFKSKLILEFFDMSPMEKISSSSLKNKENRFFR